MIRPYILPTSRETCLRIYYELKSNSDLVEAQVKSTLKTAGTLLGWGLLVQFGQGLLGTIVKTAVRVFPNERFDSVAEKDRIHNTFLDYSRRNATRHQTWHLQPVEELHVHMEAILRDIESIKNSTDRAKRRYLPARLHMASGLARIISQKKNGTGGAASLNENKHYSGLALAGLAALATSKL